MSTEPQVSLNEQRLADTIGDVSAILTAPENVDVARLPEEVFVKVFLPIFAGDKENLYEKEGASIDMWRNIARGPFKEVAVVDHSNRVLFQVPPLFNKEAMTPLDGKVPGLQSVTDMIMSATLIAKRGENQMNNYLESEFTRRHFMFSSEKDESEYIERWNKIFARYNRPPINLGAVKATTPQASTTDDSEEFDDPFAK